MLQSSDSDLRGDDTFRDAIIYSSNEGDDGTDSITMYCRPTALNEECDDVTIYGNYSNQVIVYCFPGSDCDSFIIEGPSESSYQSIYSWSNENNVNMINNSNGSYINANSPVFIFCNDTELGGCLFDVYIESSGWQNNINLLCVNDYCSATVYCNGGTDDSCTMSYDSGCGSFPGGGSYCSPTMYPTDVPTNDNNVGDVNATKLDTNVEAPTSSPTDDDSSDSSDTGGSGSGSGSGSGQSRVRWDVMGMGHFVVLVNLLLVVFFVFDLSTNSVE